MIVCADKLCAGCALAHLVSVRNPVSIQSIMAWLGLESISDRSVHLMPKTLFRAFAILALAITSIASPVLAQNTEKAPPAVQAEFNTFIAKFRAAMKANDATAVTSMTRFPFLHMSDLRDEPAFRKQIYPKFFTARLRDCVQKARPVYALDGLKNHNFTIFCGKIMLLIEKPAAGGDFRFAEAGFDGEG
jgi:hypothetical protein